MLLWQFSGRLPCSVAMAGILLCSHSAIAGSASGYTPGMSAGMTAQKACVDPMTGRLVSPEERPECKTMLDEREGEAKTESGAAKELEQSGEGLEEERLPDGSARIDLQGRFKQKSLTPPAAPAPQGGGWIAIIDPQTGRLMSGDTATLIREREALRAPLEDFEAQLEERLAASQDVSGLTEERLATGAVKIDLQGRFRSPLVARTGADGAVVIRHENPAAK
jgi:hypothetical protein